MNENKKLIEALTITLQQRLDNIIADVMREHGIHVPEGADVGFLGEYGFEFTDELGFICYPVPIYAV